MNTDLMCTCGHGAASAHDTDSSIPAFTACVVTGCTCKAFTAAPEPAPRRARRDTVRYILDRLDRGLTLTENERLALRNRINAEQADGDQAREQLAGQLAIAETNRAEAEALRVTLADALGHPTGRTWAELIGAARILRTDVLGSTRHRAETAEQEARDARQGETEAIRAREAAEQMLGREQRIRRETEDQLTAARKDAATARIRSGRNIADARRNRDAWRNARKRAALMTAEVTRRAPLNGEYAARAIEAEVALTEAREKYKAGLREADEKLRAMNAELERYADGTERPVLWSVYNRMHSRAATAEATVRDYENRITWETNCGEHAALLDSCRDAEERAEQAEATLTAVRKAAYKLADGTFAGARASCLVLDALGAPQPATADVDPVCGCGAAECEICTPMRHLTAPEQPAALDGAALWAAIRDHAARDHQFWDQLNRHYGQLYRRGVRP